jgi:hypothetical protein
MSFRRVPARLSPFHPFSKSVPTGLSLFSKVPPQPSLLSTQPCFVSTQNYVSTTQPLPNSAPSQLGHFSKKSKRHTKLSPWTFYKAFPQPPHPEAPLGAFWWSFCIADLGSNFSFCSLFEVSHSNRSRCPLHPSGGVEGNFSHSNRSGYHWHRTFIRSAYSVPP